MTEADVKKVCRTNLLEDDGEEVEIRDGMFNIQLRPFEVATWKLQLNKHRVGLAVGESLNSSSHEKHTVQHFGAAPITEIRGITYEVDSRM